MRLWLLLLLFGMTILEAQTIDLSKVTQRKDFQLQYYADVNNTQDINSIQNQTFSQIKNDFTLDNKRHTHWFKFELINLGDERLQLVLSENESYFDPFIFYTFDENKKLVNMSRMGKYVSMKDKQFKITHPAIHFELEPKQTKTVYVKLATEFFFRNKFEINTLNEFTLKTQYHNAFFIFYFGIILAIGFYFIIIFFASKESIYIYYAFYTFTLVLFALAHSTLYNYFLNPKWVDILYGTVSISYIFLIIVTEKIFEKEKRPLYFSQIALGYKIAFLISGLLMFYNPTIGGTFTYIMFVSVFFFALYILRYSSKENRLYFIGLFIYLGSSLSLPLVAFNIIPNTFWTRNLFLLGAFVEIMFFATILAQRYNKLRIEKITANENLVLLQQEQNTLLKQKVEEQTHSYKLLLKELQHRVKNNFQFISTFLWAQKKTSQNLKAQEALIQVQDRVYAIATLHEMLDEKTATKLSLNLYIEKIVTTFQQNHKNIKIECNICYVETNYDVSISLGLIVNELLTNSYKYAFHNVTDPHIDIRTSQKEGKCHFEYQDNGVGYEKGTLDKTKGFGYAFISEFAEQLTQSKISVDGNHGFYFSLTFNPLRKDLHATDS